MKHLIVDANLVVRLLAGDDPKQSPAAAAILADAERGLLRLHMDAVAVAECVYVLTGARLKRPRAQVAAALTSLLQNPGIEAPDFPILTDALKRYVDKNVDFQDAWLAARSAASGNSIVSFDRDFDLFSDIERIEP